MLSTSVSISSQPPTHPTYLQLVVEKEMSSEERALIMRNNVEGLEVCGLMVINVRPEFYQRNTGVHIIP